MSTYPHLFPPAVNAMVHNQCAAFKGIYEKDGADQRRDGLPTHAFWLRLAEWKVPLPHSDLGHILSLFCHPVSDTVSLSFSTAH